MSTESTERRLRHANPVRPATDADAADLYTRITSLPGDPRLVGPRRGRFLHRRRAVVLAFALGVAALLASTAFAVSQWISDDVVRTPVTRQEYLDAQKQLTLPPGTEWPPFRPGPSPDDTVTSRGAGGGQAVLIAQNAWECYWVEAIGKGDAAAGKRAHDELDALLANNIVEAPAGAPEGWHPTPLPTVPLAVFAHDGGLAWIRANYERAAAGDPRRLAQSCRANAASG